MFKRLRFPNPGKRISHHRLNDVKRPDRDSPIFVDPKPQIVNEFRMKNGQPRSSVLTLSAISFVQVRLPCAE